ncbi:MAG: hypothetical protein U5M23_00235 [Marinagarivorans sp.]|nr:hypothetical protein [Marinagarivorans sp.]
MTFSTSALLSLSQFVSAIAAGTKRIYYFGIIVFASLWLAGVVVYSVGQYFGERYYQHGGDAAIARQLAPTIAVAKAATQWARIKGVTAAARWCARAQAAIVAIWSWLQAEEALMFAVIAEAYNKG